MKSSIIRTITTKPRYGMLLIGIIFFFLYLSTAPITNIGYADSDELLAVAYHLGVAHPPGYPLYVLLLGIFTHLPIPGTVAFKGHLLSVVLSSISISIIYLSCFILSQKILAKNEKPLIDKSTDPFFISFISTTLLGISFLYWIYSTIAEVFALNNLYTAILLFQITRIFLDSKPTSKQWWLLAITFGLGLGHHQTYILLAPSVLALMWFKKKFLNIHTLIRMTAFGLITFLVPFLLLPIFNANNAPVSWEIAANSSGLTKHIFRQQFTGVVPESGKQVNAYLPEINIEQIIDILPTYSKNTLIFFGLGAIIAAVIGIKALYDYDKQLTIIYLAGFIIAGPIFAGILGWPTEVGFQANAQRLTIMAYLYFPLFLTPGWILILTRVKKALTILFSKPRYSLGIMILLPISIIAFRIYTQYPNAYLRDFTAVSNMYSKMMDEFKPDAIVGCFSDPSCFALLYEQSVNNNRPDITLIPRAHPLVDRRLDAQDLEGFDYPGDPFRTFDILTWNLDEHPTYLVDISEFYFNLLGLDAGFLFYVPHGYYGELTKSMPDQFPPADFTTAEALLNTNIPTYDRMRLTFLGSIARVHRFNSVMAINSGFRDRARDELNIAANIQEKLAQILGTTTTFGQQRELIESAQPNERFLPGSEQLPLEEFFSLIEQWETLERQDSKQIAHKLAVGAIAVYPEDINARLKVAQTFEELGDTVSAQTEYENVLKLDPENEDAKEGLLNLHQQTNPDEGI